MKRFLWSLAAAAALAAPSVTFAQQPTTMSGPSAAAGASEASTPAAQETKPNTGALTLTGGVDLVTAYYFRGYLQENSGFIAQPYATVTANLHTSDEFTLNAYVGTWNSVQSAKTLAASGPSDWYESDFYGGVDFIFGKFDLGAIYTFYQYPNGAFKTIQEIGFKLSYDDTDLMKKAGVDFALKPYVAVYFETQDGNGTDDSYGEIGINPSFALADGKVTLSFPVTLGVSLDDYYLQSDGSNSFFGYASVGAFATVPLPIPAKYGAWSATGGVWYYQMLADSVEVANNGTDNQFVGKLGIAVTY